MSTLMEDYLERKQMEQQMLLQAFKDHAKAVEGNRVKLGEVRRPAGGRVS
jgi:hypothetical protein